MFEPAFKIRLCPKPKFAWAPPLSRTIVECACWNESDLRVPCSVVGCKSTAKVEYDWYKEGVRPKLKHIGNVRYDSSFKV